MGGVPITGRQIHAMLLFVILSLSGHQSAADNQLPQPNIIFFFSDDMGWGDSRIINPDSKIIMPNIERLADEGMMFTDAHTSAAVCAPSRYSALTGNYQWRGRNPWGVWQYTDPSQILDGQNTVGDTLKSAGYQTAFFGKLHLGGDFFKIGSIQVTRIESEVDFSRRFRKGPLDHGFDLFLCIT